MYGLDINASSEASPTTTNPLAKAAILSGSIVNSGATLAGFKQEST
jgi:hypothetical protein